MGEPKMMQIFQVLRDTEFVGHSIEVVVSKPFTALRLLFLTVGELTIF